MTIDLFSKRKMDKTKITMVTCYDYSFAKILNSTDVDCLLVGDSAAMVMHGHPNTVTANMEMMELHVRSVAKGASQKFIVGDLPFLAFRQDLKTNVLNAGRLLQAGAHSVKLEGASGNLELIRHLTESGIPVMGHLGLTPQFVNMMGGYKVQGKTASDQERILQASYDLQKAGCFALVLECVPSHLAKKIAEELSIAVIGIGAGPDTDGQVLVLQDLLGFQSEFKPKFVRRYVDLEQITKAAIQTFCQDVKSQDFPAQQESYE